jgi:hypothetical protein
MNLTSSLLYNSQDLSANGAIPFSHKQLVLVLPGISMSGFFHLTGGKA